MWRWNKPLCNNDELAHYGIKGQKWGIITKEYEPIDDGKATVTPSYQIRKTPSVKSISEQKTPKRHPKDTTGRFGRGNIDLNNRKVVNNSDGSISTERSFSCNIDGKEVLLPTVIDGKIVSEDEAIDYYFKTGKYLGKFDTVEEAEKYAEELHNRQDWFYNGNKLEKEIRDVLNTMRRKTK